jgi:myo-inositol-1(or 4)-monophosphatase
VTENADFSDDLALLTSTALRAGEIAMSFFRKKLEISWKAGFSPVTNADMEVDNFLKRELCGARPDYGWLSEETLDNAARLTKRRTFVVDPIDGTRSFMEGGDVWCVSVAVIENNRPVAGILVCPARAETYSAAKGQGAYFNGKRLELVKMPEEIVLSIPKSIAARLAPFWKSEFKTVPHMPSLAYRIAMIAAGKIHGTVIKPNSHDWDLAAADLILSEVGGRLLDANGKQLQLATENPANGVLIAARPELTDEVLQVVAAAGL